MNLEKSPEKATEKLLGITADEIESREEAADLAASLRKVISYHDHRYYVMNDPVISDSEYDRLFHLLEDVEDRWPDLVTSTSPTQRIGEKVSGEFPEVDHLTPMLSLDNSYDLEDLEDFDKRVRKLIGKKKVNYTVEPKLDGAGISLVYEDDKFVRGATRGDGRKGEDITHNLRVLRSIPLKINISELGISRVEIRGEVLIEKQEFKQLNKQREGRGESLLANPRNAAAGSLRLQDPEEVARRKLSAWIYQISYAEDAGGREVLASQFETQEQVIATLHKLGFKTPSEHLESTESAEQLLDICKDWEERREEFPYEIDGVVIKVNDLKLYDELGLTSHHPRWAIAYKFRARQATTKLMGVHFQVGRTGTITPVAELDPVEVGGVSISSATLHNEDYINNRDIQLNDTVLLERAGDVIPYIVKPIKEHRHGNTQKIRFPRECPSCGSALVRPEGEASWRCVNASCPAQAKQRIKHYVSKQAMDIDGLGAKIVEQFYEKGLLQTIPDLYDLDYDKIRQMEGFGEKSVSNLKKAVDASRGRPIRRLIYALSIPMVGADTARTLAESIECVTDLESSSREDLMKLNDIGSAVAESVQHFFDRKENIGMIKNLEAAGVQVCKSKEEREKKDTLAGLTFVFTGALESYTREEAKELVERRGGRAVGSISSKVDYLVQGTEPGSKLDEARDKGIPVIDEEKFLELLNE
ncbi:NAD-dependent DNA ligase LigA [Fodinibius sediminis]|uniref:NAD-dependent DNA ligase LigA n=1 Tax=Fodinibius sediminis TaxID=1214077 RepID=UPI001C8F8462|nr:NAD-dependent DNA ligase LigA [Fodinibius sediminis]